MSKEIKKLIPDLRFPEFVNEGEWEEKKLFEVCKKISQGGTPDTANSDYWNGVIEWITPAEMGKIETRFVKSTARKISELGLKNCSSDLLPINSVILSTRAPIGHLVINKTEMAMNQGCKALICNNKTHYDYLYYCLLFNKKFLSDLGAGNTFKELSASSLKNFQIHIPSIIEQQKIAACLSSLDEVITAHSQKLDLLKEHKKGLMQNLFPQEGEKMPKLRFKEFVDDGEWKFKELNELGELINGLTYCPDDVREKGLLVLRSSNIQNGLIDFNDCVYVRTDIKGANLSKPNDILVCVRNGSKNLIGKNAIIPKEIPFATHGAFMTIFRAKNPNFVFQLFQTDFYDTQVKADLGATINSINGKNFLKYEFPIPDNPNEQQKIASCLSELDKLITAQAEKIEQLKLHKKGLMQGLFPKIN